MVLNKNLEIEDIIQLLKEKSVDKEWSFEGFKPSETSKWTHCYHTYPAKFIPQLVEKLIEKYINTENASINDPFFGSGTTIATGIAKGFFVSGTDINKIAYLITKVKSTPIEPKYLENKINQFLIKIEKALITKQTFLFDDCEVIPLIPKKHTERIDYWFENSNKNELGKILQIIYNEEDKSIRDFFLVAFSNILKSCSIWLQSNTKPTRDFKKKPSKPYDCLKKQLNKMKKGNAIFYEIVPDKIKTNLDKYLNIINDDAKRQPNEDNSVDLIISSSPYVTSYEYSDLHQLSTIWLDFADDLTEYKKNFIGTSFKQYEGKKLKSKIANQITNQMFDINKKMSKEIEAFFIDMQQVFDESYRILKKRGRCCYVIGNTKLKGVEILNAEVFTESLQISGFKIDRIIKREIPSKILPQKRNEKTGRFASNDNANTEAYPIEYIIIGIKEINIRID